MKRMVAFLCVIAPLLSINVQHSYCQQSQTGIVYINSYGFEAPNEGSIFVGYDKLPYRLKNNPDGGDPYCLEGIRGGFSVSTPLIGALGVELPISISYNSTKDSNPGDGKDYLKRTDLSMQIGLIFCTSYRFNDKCRIAIGLGPKIEYGIADKSTWEKSGMKYEVNYLSGHYKVTGDGTKKSGTEDKLEQIRPLDFPICIEASLRYGPLGVYFSYDYGLRNKYNKKYYEVTGDPRNYKQYNDHLSVGLQIFLY